MPFIRDCSQTKGKAEPASAFLSPVARDYPSRALRRFFMPAALRLFHQRTRANVRRCAANVTVLFCTTYSQSAAVNNLAATLSTGCSPRPRIGFDPTCECRCGARFLSPGCRPRFSRMSPRDLPIYELEPAIVAGAARRRGGSIVQAPTGSGKSTQMPADAAASRISGCGPGGGPAAAAAGGAAARQAGGGGGGHAARRDGRLPDPARLARVGGHAHPVCHRGHSPAADVLRSGAARRQRARLRRVSRAASLRRHQPRAGAAAAAVRAPGPEAHRHVRHARRRRAARTTSRPASVLVSAGAHVSGRDRIPAEARRFRARAGVGGRGARMRARGGARRPATCWSSCPGAYEISRTVQAVQNEKALRDFLVLPLHGELPPEAQDRAVARYDRRKIIVSTNVAETSLTIDGVTAVDRQRTGPHARATIRTAASTRC